MTLLNSCKDHFVILAHLQNGTLALAHSVPQPVQIDTIPSIAVFATLIHWQKSIIVHGHLHERTLLAATQKRTLSPTFVILPH